MRPLPVRSLAVSAVSALAISALATVAAPASQAADSDVVLLSQFNPGRDASVRFDGWDSGITLTAQRLDPTASIGFELNTNPAANDASAGWRPITGGVSQTGDVVSLIWNGTNYRGTSMAGRSVAIRAVATVEDGAGGTATSYSRRNQVRIAAASVDAASVSLMGTENEGFFAQPYTDTGRTRTLTRVDGSTSATEGTVPLSWRGDDGKFHGATNARVTPTVTKVPGFPGFPGLPEIPGLTEYGQFSHVVDITEYGAEDGDVIAFAAHRDTDEVRASSVYEQTVGSVQAGATGPARNGTDGEVSVYVRDAQVGAPVIGAEVRRSSDGALVGYTGLDGQVVATQPAGTTDTYYANATDADAYLDTDGDRVSEPVTVEGYDPTPNYPTPVFADGAAFDDDEYAPGDLGLEVQDQHGRPVGAGASVVYRLSPVGGEAPAALQQATTDEDGVATVDFDPAMADGDVRLEYRLGTETDPVVGDPLNYQDFTAGDAVLVLSPASRPAVAPSGGQIDYTGSLTVEDVPMTGRRISLQYLRGVEVAPGRTADAGLVSGAGVASRRVVTTDGAGLFEVTVADRNERPAASEVGGRLLAETDGNAAERTSSTTRFGDGRRGTVAVGLHGRGNGARADVLRVGAPASVAGETVRVFRRAGGRLVLEHTAVLNRDGDLPYLAVRDHNGTATTTYVVRLSASKRVLGAVSNERPLS